MVRETRGSRQATQNKSVTATKSPKKKPIKGRIEKEASSESDSGSEGEFEDIVSATLKEFSSTAADVESGSDSGEDDTDCESESNSGQDCFILDKNPVTLSSTSLQGHSRKGVKQDRPIDDGTQQSVSDNKGNEGESIAHRGSSANPSTSKSKNDKYELVTELDPGIDMSDIYVNCDVYKNPQPSKKIAASQSCAKSDILKGSVLNSEFEKKLQTLPYEQSRNQLKKQRRAERAKTNGKGWFDMPAQEMTEEKKNDLMVLQMRRVLDPKRFYKGPDIRTLPKFFQMGRIVEGPADFYHSRIPKKQRKATLVDELLADAEFRKQNKRKYAELVEQKKVSAAAYKHMKRLKKHKKR